MRIKSTRDGFKKVNFFGLTKSKLIFGKFTQSIGDTSRVYNARIIHENGDTEDYTDATHALIAFTETSDIIFKWKP